MLIFIYADMLLLLLISSFIFIPLMFKLNKIAGLVQGSKLSFQLWGEKTTFKFDF